jgi:hypothetical protein
MPPLGNVFHLRCGRGEKRLKRPRNQSASPPKSNEKDIGIVYRRREEATELFGFHVEERTDQRGAVNVGHR